MPRPDFPFDAVLFDLDGTLVATDRFWPDAARAGALRAFVELGLERDLPSEAEWMDMVGRPLHEGFARVFGDLEPEPRARVMELCVEEEERLLAEGRMGFLPGVEATLEDLARRGVRMGIASNCGQNYLDAMTAGLGLARWIEQGRCLDSPRIGNKADMIEDLLMAFDTRSAVFVGDRNSDRDAAWANGLPHVHLARGYAAAGEDVEAEAVIAGLDRLVPRLLGRAAWLARTATQLELPAGPQVVGVVGGPASGKSLFARDLAATFSAAGRPALALELERFRRPVTGQPPAAPFARVDWEYDLDALATELLAPVAAGNGTTLVRGGPALKVPAGTLVVLAGDALLHPRVLPGLARIAYLEVPERLIERRLAGREARAAGPRALAAARERLAVHAALVQACPPAALGLVIDASNPLGPLDPTWPPGPESGPDA